MSIFLRDYSVLTASGLGKDAFDAALRREVPIPVASIPLKAGTGTVSFPILKADLSRLKDYIPPKTTRRMDTFGRIALLLAASLLHGKPEEEHRDQGLVVATGYGSFSTNMEFLETVFAQGHAGASPMIFSSTVHNSAMAAVGIHFAMQGPACTLSMFKASPGGAFVLAETWLASGKADQVLVLVADDVPHLAAYHESRTGPAPDSSWPEILLAEGGAGFLLGRTGPLRLAREDSRPVGDPLFGGREEGSVSHAHAFGRTFGAAGFELCAAALELEKLERGSIAVDFSAPGAAPLFYRLLKT
jgi:3-oxoacyl-[acyl-carrier-protein] synthase II